MTSPGRAKGVVVLQSTHDVTVVLNQESNGRSYSTLVLPANVFPSGYFLLTPDGLNLTSQVDITALMNGTRVVVKLTGNLTQLAGSIAGFPLHGNRYVNTTLEQYETAYIQVNGDTSGTFVYADKPVAVFVNTQYQVSNKTTRHLEVAQPVDSMTSYHVTFPSRSEFASCDVYKLLSHYDNTKIKVFESNRLAFSYNLTKAGDVTVARLPNDRFYLLYSDVSHPFYVTRVGQGAKAACTISFIPRRFWRRQVDFEITSERETIYVIKNGISSIVQLETPSIIASIDMTCSVIIDSKLYVCVMTLQRGIHHLRSEDGTTVMAAYTEAKWSQDGVSCRPLGVDNFAKFNSGTLFPSESFVTGSLNQSFPSPMTPQMITSLAAQDEIVTSLPPSTLNNGAANDILQQCYPDREQTSTTTRATPTTKTTGAPPPTTTTARTPSATTTTRATPTTTTTHAPTTATTLNPLLPTLPTLSCVPTPPMCPNISTLISNMINLNNTLSGVSLSTDKVLPNNTNFETDLRAVCDTLYSTLLNVTLVPKNVFSMLHIPVVDLRLRKKDMSAYKRMQVSTWDGRFSSQVIGMSGVAFLVIWFIILSLSDTIRMAKFIFLKNQKTTSNETRNLE
ncbi:unnamed protein product [Lymnaea stagnalis]|uniref:IgGFc-binding protein N-terminal domain-containing protein n=1 Tax=Lymnaea stagnalis TaxID=6523 RepID=A0AAV2IHC5_LYMST